jgi:hypothetical protein
MDAFLISAGVASWFGFTASLLIWAFSHGVGTLASLSRANRKYVVLAAILRVAIWAFSLFGLFGFAAFYGQLAPSKNISAIFLIIGASTFYLSLYIFRKLEKHVVKNT